MPRKRSRSDTEQRFQDAVLDLVADSGFAKLGINSVAERAGADKVLIYRYFGDLEGLLHRVAESRSWLPSAEQILDKTAPLPRAGLRHIFKQISQHVRQDAATHHIALWRHAVQNPLTGKYREEWKNLWKELAEGLSGNMSHEDRKDWNRALELLALVTQSEIYGEAVDTYWIDRISEGLEPGDQEEGMPREQEDILPTNLL